MTIYAISVNARRSEVEVKVTASPLKLITNAPFELSTQQALLKVSYDYHIAGNGLYTMLVTTFKDSKTSKHVSIL